MKVEVVEPGLLRRPAGGGNVAAARKLPLGAEFFPGHGTHFRVWAPSSQAVEVEFADGPERDHAAPMQARLQAEPNGYFSGLVAEGRPGRLYRYRLDAGAFPDPVSRFQPEGPHGPSQIVDPECFVWRDEDWPGVAGKGQVLYEMHIGTFTPQGTWSAAAEQLPELRALGITVVELMPAAEFAGGFGWGYDGVDLFAPTHLYGTPDEFRAFVDRAHQLGVGVLLDVVYNHLGPDGNYLKQFSPDYFTDRYTNEWGEAVNFDGPNSGPVREFFITNARYWISEFHLDGLRLDATQQMFDSSADNIVGAITREARQAAGRRRTFIVAENEPQQARLAGPAESGGQGIDALWNDDFHHSATVALTGHNEAYYSDYQGTAQEFISAVKWGYLYQGQWFSWQKKRRGSPAFELAPEQFINYLQNHDQVANSQDGRRLAQLASAGSYRALTALLLLGPGTPMLFQGQEFAASAPFLYFAGHHPELANLVAKGRREFLSQFPSLTNGDIKFPDPAREETFRSCKLDFSERRSHAQAYALHRDLLTLRREDPVFANPRRGGVDGAVLGRQAFALRFFGGRAGDRLLLVNLGVDLLLRPCPEPLLVEPEGCAWTIQWSSESPLYGGNGTPPLEPEGNWRVRGHAALVLAPVARPAT